jgi:hypothetical protein
MALAPVSRTTFSTNRTLEFFSERELTMQLGVRRERWALALLKELLDNALDAAEQMDRPPVITITADAEAHTLSVQDNGPGLPLDTLQQSLDYTVRVSDKTYYVSPSRGQLGNALKCLWAIPYVRSGARQHGQVDVCTGGVRYEVRVSVDHIAQQPMISLTPVPAPKVKSGTIVTIHWPWIASSAPLGADATFYFWGMRALVQEYALFNPHATFVCRTREGPVTYAAQDPGWRKWTPKAPTSPHWYTPQQFQALLSAFLHADRQTEAGARLLSDVLAEFDGFSGSAARREIILLTGKAQPWKHSSYFTQHLLPDFMEAHPDLTANWDVVFDARGHFREPHTAYEFGLGTVEVRNYLQLWTSQLSPRLDTLTLPHTITTWGPACRYQYALFIEKEGFDALLEQAQIEGRYDVALMSTKGMTVTAARQLIEALSRAGVTILVVHDFDKPGLEILHKFTANTRRYRYTSTPTVIDLGLRLEEALAMGLESEPVPYETQVDPKVHLRECGATEAECAFLVTERKRDIRNGKWHVSWVGERIELNAMDSQQFLDWLEAKLQAAGVAKVVPDDDALAVAYRHLQRIAMLEQALEAARALPVAETPVPADLAAQIRGRITDTAAAWDDALWDIVRAQEATPPEPEASP